ncbi:type IV pilin protein [Psychrobacter sp. JCM 18902]|uniref:type IV pilin protein n=1 Tax=Psychrobacter sp. JCM 18902 TaxID=1298607 RepID=UPI0005EDA2D3|nr:type IV pilin protein [Psychrobacter sp. JCM 18902]
MNRDMRKLPSTSNPQLGFTLMELMIVVTIIGILAAIAYPNYQHYIMKSKRTDMMSEMHNIAAQIESRKLAEGTYSNTLITGLGGDFPRQGTALYTITFTPNPLTSEWSIIATPKTGSQMVNDGILSLNHQNNKCRGSVCDIGNNWND